MAATLSTKKVSASATAQKLGTTGAVGDLIDCILIIPTAETPGVVYLYDAHPTGAEGTDYIKYTLYAGVPATPAKITDLAPCRISDLELISTLGPWHVTTGANIEVVVIGRFAD